MDKKEYLKKYEELTKKMEVIRNELLEVKKEYIASNTKYPIGTKVKITYNDTKYINNANNVIYGVVVTHEISYGNDEVYPVIAKMKKDGTPHPKARHYISWYRKPTVEIVE